MSKYRFPSIAIDNFFENPDKIREFALKQDFMDSADPRWVELTKWDNYGKWPGKRTRHIGILDSELYNRICAKFFCTFFNPMAEPKLKWDVEMYFQISDPYFDNSDLNRGWIHHDGNCLAGLIYLTPDIDSSCGTTIWDIKKGVEEDETHLKIKNDLYAGKFVDEDECKKSLDLVYSQYEKKIEFKNKYNTLIAYDGTQYHALTNMAKERLTLVFFVTKLTGTPNPGQKISAFQL